jgi:uncharacterized protein (DUF983 family)
MAIHQTISPASNSFTMWDDNLSIGTQIKDCLIELPRWQHMTIYVSLSRSLGFNLSNPVGNIGQIRQIKTGRQTPVRALTRGLRGRCSRQKATTVQC